jgi:tRNA(His) 5'-end guanylyltransferase
MIPQNKFSEAWEALCYHLPKRRVIQIPWEKQFYIWLSFRVIEAWRNVVYKIFHWNLKKESDEIWRIFIMWTKSSQVVWNGTRT